MQVKSHSSFITQTTTYVKAAITRENLKVKHIIYHVVESIIMSFIISFWSHFFGSDVSDLTYWFINVFTGIPFSFY